MSFDAEKFYNDLDEAYGRYDNDATERFMLQTLEDVKGDKRAETAVLNELACFYRNTSKWQQCIDSFSRLLRVMEENGDDKGEDYALAVLNKAGSYRIMGEYDKALETFAHVKELLDKLGDADPYSYASLNNNTGLAYHGAGNYEKAAECFERGLEYLPDIPDNITEKATNLANLAAAYWYCGKRALAIEKLDAALEIFKDLDGGMNAHYAGALNTKGVFLYTMGDYAGAAKQFEAAIERTKLIFGENKEYVSACRSLASTYAKLGDNETAARYLAKGEEVAKKIAR